MTDGHYEQVMNARRQAGTGRRWYFGYTTVLDEQAFNEWKSQHGYGFFALPPGRIAQVQGATLECNFPSRFWGGRVAGLVVAPGRSVWGKLYEIAEADWPIISHKEGGVTQMSVEQPVVAVVGDERVEATAFVTNPRRVSSEGAKSASFVAAVLRGAERAGLPADWVAELRQLCA